MEPDLDDVLEEAIKVDLTDPLLYSTERPERIWRTLRRAGQPVRSHGFRDHWAVTRYAQIEEIYRVGHMFSSAKGMHLGEKSTDDLAGEAAGGLSLLVSDDPMHAQMRRPLSPAFTPRMMTKLADSTLEIARRLVREAISQPSIDFVAAVAAPLPAIVVCDLLGVPESDRGHVVKLTQAAFSGSGYATSSTQIAAHAALFGYCDQLLAMKRRVPGDDVTTILANARIDGKPISREVAIMNCHDLIAGGNETARHASASAAATMVTHRTAWKELRNGLASIADATEEILRFEAPVNHVMRVAVQDVEIGEVVIRTGEFVTLWLRSANRDEDVFENPDELRFSRQPNRHITFGLGSHYCIAAALARIEISAIIQALCELARDAEFAGAPQRLESNFFRGYNSLPMALSMP